MDYILNSLYYILPFIILLGILVFVHEFGHFIIARSVGVKVSTFSVGFGKTLWSRQDKKGTLWKIGAIPLGGYCQFLGDGDGSSSTESNELSSMTEEEKKYAFATQNIWKKLAIVIAGPAFNYIFAILVLFSIYYGFGKIVFPPIVGEVMEGGTAQVAGIEVGDKIVSINGINTPDFQSIANEISLTTENNVAVSVERPLSIKLRAQEYNINKLTCKNEKQQQTKKILGLISVQNNNNTGDIFQLPTIVGSIAQGSAADIAGFQKGDIIESINGQELQSFGDLKKYVEEHNDDEFEIIGTRPIVFNVTLQETDYTDETEQTIKRKMLGIKSSQGIIITDKNMTVLKSLNESINEVYDLTVATLRSLGQMIVGKRETKDVGGIIRVAEMSGDLSKTGGLISFIYFMALLSVNLGLINILPIPVLDGGHVMIYLIELVIRRELNANAKEYIFKFGLIIILGLFLFSTWNDIVHLINRWSN